jgi:hypothetical protein
LPTGQIFGCITQKGPNKKLKSRVAGKIAAEFWLILYRNGRKRGQTSGKFVLLFFFSLIISNSKNCITLLADIDKDSLVSKGKMPSTRFFLSGCIFVLNWPEKSAKSWPNCSADRATESVPIQPPPPPPCLAQYLSTESWAHEGGECSGGQIRQLKKKSGPLLNLTF